MTLSDEERLREAAGAAGAIVHQCLVHAERATAKLTHRVNNASRSSIHGQDMAVLRQQKYLTALRQRVHMVESNSNGMLSQLRGLDVLMRHDTFLPIPAVSVVRSIAEIAATTSWLLRADVSVEDRAARSYATMFRALEKAILATGADDSSRLVAYREHMVEYLREEGAVAVRKERKGITYVGISHVTIGKAHAKVDFNQTQRMQQEIPKMGTLYSALSGVAHGEQMHLASTWETPDSLARLIGRVAQWSVQAWSRAVHEWVGVSHGPFISREHLWRLLASTPPAHIEEFGVADLDV